MWYCAKTALASTAPKHTSLKNITFQLVAEKFKYVRRTFCPVRYSIPASNKVLEVLLDK